jgi:hypothetical protein
MSAGSDASNLGYGRFPPNSNINPQFVNVGNTNNPANFSSNEIPTGLLAAKNNVDAANGCIPGACYKGGKKLKRKINNISRMYKMPKKSLRKRVRTMKRKIMSRIKRHRTHRKHGSHKRRHSHTKSRRHSRRMRYGGYGQYMNNTPYTPNYAVANTTLSASQSALANPPPISLNTKGLNIDNYNHYTNKGFPSKND